MGNGIKILTLEGMKYIRVHPSFLTPKTLFQMTHRIVGRSNDEDATKQLGSSWKHPTNGPLSSPDRNLG